MVIFSGSSSSVSHGWQWGIIEKEEALEAKKEKPLWFSHACPLIAADKRKQLALVQKRAARRTDSSFQMSLAKGLALKHLLKQKGQG